MAGNRNSGRHRKPAAKLKLLGEYREDRHGDRFDDSHLDSAVEKPEGMNSVAERFWDSVVPGLVEAGYVKAIDQPQLRGMCEWWARYITASTWLSHRQTRGALDGELKDVELIAKIHGMAQKAWAAFSAVASRFGMTPSDRAKLAAEPKEEADEFDKDRLKHG
jgi:P27 family predicted phage terminase small subunit